jgi:acyl carrier protein
MKLKGELIMLERSTIEQTIANFLQDDCGVDIRMINNDTSLFKSAILNSIDIINMVVFIEKKFGISVDVFEIGLDSFESINAMANYVENKLSATV